MFSDDDIPSAPPLVGSIQHENQVPEKNPALRADADPCSATAGVSAAVIEPNKYKSTTLGSADVETSEMSTRYYTT